MFRRRRSTADDPGASTPHRAGRVRVTGLLVGVALMAAACSSGGAATTTTTTTDKAAVATTTTTAPQITSSTVVLGGKSVPVPTEGDNKPISSNVDTGQQVIVTSKGFLPALLFAALHTPVTFTNLSSKTVTLTLPFTGVAPATLAPGASTSWTPNVLQFQYRSSTGYRGKAQVGAFSD
jgi:hypothetical protein